MLFERPSARTAVRTRGSYVTLRRGQLAAIATGWGVLGGIAGSLVTTALMGIF